MVAKNNCHTHQSYKSIEEYYAKLLNWPYLESRFVRTRLLQKFHILVSTTTKVRSRIKRRSNEQQPDKVNWWIWEQQWRRELRSPDHNNERKCSSQANEHKPWTAGEAVCWAENNIFSLFVEKRYDISEVSRRVEIDWRPEDSPSK